MNNRVYRTFSDAGKENLRRLGVTFSHKMAKGGKQNKVKEQAKVQAIGTWAKEWDEDDAFAEINPELAKQIEAEKEEKRKAEKLRKAKEEEKKRKLLAQQQKERDEVLEQVSAQSSEGSQSPGQKNEASKRAWTRGKK